MYASVSPVRKKISAVMCCRLGGRECVRESVIQGSELVLVSKRVCVGVCWVETSLPWDLSTRPDIIRL